MVKPQGERKMKNQPNSLYAEEKQNLFCYAEQFTNFLWAFGKKNGRKQMSYTNT